jgi:hypothetical protein
MKSLEQILAALNRLSRITVQGVSNEDRGVLYGRMNYVDGMRRSAIEIANWIVSDEEEMLAEAVRSLSGSRGGLGSNGRSFNLKVNLDPDLMEAISENNWKLSEVINNALALSYLKQMRTSNRLDRRQRTLREGPFYGKTAYTVALDEDLHEALEEHVEELKKRFGMRQPRAQLVSSALRNYFWALNVLDGDRNFELPKELATCCS